MPQNRFEFPEWLRIFLAYGMAIVGILALSFLVALFLHSWVIGLWLILIVIPIFPAVQTILLKKKRVKPVLFLKIYFAEFASLSLQLALLVVSVPFIVIGVAGRLVIGLLVTAVICWFVVGLQQLGVDIGAKMPKQDIMILLWVTIGLTAGAGIYYFFHRIGKKYEDSYFSLWARLFKKTRELYRYETQEQDCYE